MSPKWGNCSTHLNFLFLPHRRQGAALSQTEVSELHMKLYCFASCSNSKQRCSNHECKDPSSGFHDVISLELKIQPELGQIKYQTHSKTWTIIHFTIRLSSWYWLTIIDLEVNSLPEFHLATSEVLSFIMHLFWSQLWVLDNKTKQMLFSPLWMIATFFYFSYFSEFSLKPKP